MTMPKEQTTVLIQVQPNARQNRVIGCNNGVWNLHIAAPPVRSRADQELISFLSDILDTAKGNITITKGSTSRRKTVNIHGLTQKQVTDRLDKHRT